MRFKIFLIPGLSKENYDFVVNKIKINWNGKDYLCCDQVKKSLQFEKIKKKNITNWLKSGSREFERDVGGELIFTEWWSLMMFTEVNKLKF
jgi:hypothetical protein